MLEFVIAGFPKCGSTSIHDLLSQNLKIDLCNRKESHYYANKELEFLVNGPGDNRLQKGVIRSKEKYLSHFRNDGNIKGESSVFYIYFEDAIRRMSKENPNLKIILVTRNPSDRIKSNYKYLRARQRETLTLSQAIEEENNRIQMGYEPIWYYTALSQYSSYIEMVKKYVKNENLLLIDFDEFFSNTSKGLLRIEKFLGVESHGDYKLKWSKNSSIPKNSIIGLIAKCGIGNIVNDEFKMVLKHWLYRSITINYDNALLRDLDADYILIKKEYKDHYGH
jgi:hypothetical protein